MTGAPDAGPSIHQPWSHEPHISARRVGRSAGVPGDAPCMTITQVARPDRTLDTHSKERAHPPPPLSARSPSLAGPMALTAGILIVVVEVMMLPFLSMCRTTSPTPPSPVFQMAGVLYLAGFCALMIALVGAYGWIARRTGWGRRSVRCHRRHDAVGR